MVNPCGKYSLEEGVRAIAIGDFIFAVVSILVHIVEGTRSVLIIVPKQIYTPYDTYNWNQDHYFVTEANKLLLWICMGISVINLFLSISLYIGVTKRNYAKCATYIIAWMVTLLLGIGSFIGQIITLNESPFYFGVVVYPCFYIYKIYSLWVVKCYAVEIRNNSKVQIPLLIKRSIRRRRKNQADDMYQPLEGYGDVITRLQFQKKDKIVFEKLRIDYHTCLEYDVSSSVLKGSLELGDGGFADVAVKTAKSNASANAVKTLLLEAKLMTKIGSHENIIKFYGYCNEVTKDKVFLVMEYYPLGTVENFLQDSASSSNFMNQVIDDRIIPRIKDHIYENVDVKSFCTMDLISWSYQIANGMDYLKTQKVVHGLLATKNILLFENNIVKISGFRFAAQLHSNENLFLKSDITGRFPWRWMAIESIEAIEELNFTEKSDVWSFGVTIWEIFTIGEVPYSDWNTDFVQALLDGRRLQKPIYCTTEIYNILVACWKIEQGDRPNFNILKLFFHQLISSLQLITNK